LFAAATISGAAAAGANCEPWRLLGEKLGEAYQVADDIRDAVADSDEIGKPTGRDAALGRPNAVLKFGLAGAVLLLENLVSEAIAAIPACPGAVDLTSLIILEAKRLLPKKLAQDAA
jgi:geranylgeranyl diphosphate synthase type II